MEITAAAEGTDASAIGLQLHLRTANRAGEAVLRSALQLHQKLCNIGVAL